jgi:hypothetical protein
MAGVLLYGLDTEKLLAVLNFAKSFDIKVSIPSAYHHLEEIKPDSDNPDLILKTFLEFAEDRVFILELAEQINVDNLFDKFDEEPDIWETNDETKEWILKNFNTMKLPSSIEWCSFCSSVVPKILCLDGSNIIIEHAGTAEQCLKLH